MDLDVVHDYPGFLGESRHEETHVGTGRLWSRTRVGSPLGAIRTSGSESECGSRPQRDTSIPMIPMVRETTTVRLFLKALIGIGVSLVLVVADRAGWASSLRGGIETVLVPPVRLAGRGVSLIQAMRETTRLVTSSQRLIDDLTRQNTILSQYIEEMVNRQKEQEAIENLIEQVPEILTRFDVRPVRVVSTGQSFLLSGNDLREGDVVVSSEGVFVGVVDRLGKWTARVRLVSDKASRLPVVVSARDGRGVEGEVVGSIGGVVTLTRVLTEEHLSEGMTITTSGFRDTLPSGFLVGWVGQQREKQEEAVYQSTGVKLAVAVDHLTTVFIVSPKS